jgi:heterodisulfide reductase subunit C
MISQIAFIIILATASYIFYKKMVGIRRNILLGRDIDLSDNSSERWKTMAMVAIGQGKMFTRPLAAVMHIFVYVGFILINMEVLEILIDGVFGTHRIFASPLGIIYDVAMAFFEILAFLVIVACVVFLFRRYIVKVKRFSGFEMRAFPVKDATTILFVEIILMSCLLLLNAVDKNLQNLQAEHYTQAGTFPISSFIVPMFSHMSVDSLEMIERIAWWGHIIGILLFMNYLPYSKHFHIIMAFPNTYYSNLNAKGKLNNMESVTTEVKLMMDPSAQPPEGYQAPTSFGVKDVTDLTWKNLMDAYTCTECGRCTSVCPANTTGKLLSPRKIMMDTRDRLEEVGANIDKNKTFVDDNKNLHDYISEQELWACTTCQACVQICPVNINPMEIIVEMRRFKVMEQSSAPQELNSMFTNIENNGAPWQMAQSARFDWSQE